MTNPHLGEGCRVGVLSSILAPFEKRIAFEGFFTLLLLFLCKVSHSAISSPPISSPLSGKHIGTELASCLLPLPSAAIIPRYRPTFWPSSLWGVGKREGNRALPPSDMRNTMKRAEGICIYPYIFLSLHKDMHRLIWKACACVCT